MNWLALNNPQILTHPSSCPASYAHTHPPPPPLLEKKKPQDYNYKQYSTGTFTIAIYVQNIVSTGTQQKNY